MSLHYAPTVGLPCALYALYFTFSFRASVIERSRRLLVHWSISQIPSMSVPYLKGFKGFNFQPAPPRNSALHEPDQPTQLTDLNVSRIYFCVQQCFVMFSVHLCFSYITRPTAADGDLIVTCVTECYFLLLFTPPMFITHY